MSQVVDRDALKELKGVFNSFRDSVSDEVKGLERLVGNDKKDEAKEKTSSIKLLFDRMGGVMDNLLNKLL